MFQYAPKQNDDSSIKRGLCKASRMGKRARAPTRIAVVGSSLLSVSVYRGFVEIIIIIIAPRSDDDDYDDGGPQKAVMRDNVSMSFTRHIDDPKQNDAC
jgi:hypothetical protein